MSTDRIMSLIADAIDGGGMPQPHPAMAAVVADCKAREAAHLDAQLAAGRNRVFAFECRVKGTSTGGTIVHDRTRSKARYDYLLRVRDCYPDITFADIDVRKVGAPITSEAFKRTAAYRGLPDLRVGQRVEVKVPREGPRPRGAIVGHNDSANFDVLFDDDSPAFAGATLNVHPGDLVLLPC